MRVRDNRMSSKKKCEVLQSLIRQVSDNLGSTNYEINSKTQQAVEKMLPLVWTSLPQKALAELLER